MLDSGYSAGARYVGCCCTRGGVLATEVTADTSTWMQRTYHYARGEPINAIRVLFGNWYVPLDDGGGETNSGSSLTVEASIEYPAGTFRRLLFGGATTKAIASGGQEWTDWLTVGIPLAQKFFIRVRRSGQTQIVYNSFPLLDVAGGDALEITTTNEVMTGTITDGSTGVAMFPLLVVGMTRSRSVMIFGDSRQSGIGETSTTTGDCGEVARIVGGSLNYANYGVRGESASHFNSNSTKRVALSKYFTHVIYGLGANDIGSGAASVEASLLTFAAKMRPRRVYAPTLPPGLGTTERVSLNGYYRGMPNEIAGCPEVADVMETARNSGTWKTGYDSDGIHESTTGNTALVGVVPAGMFTPGGTGHMPRIVMP